MNQKELNHWKVVVMMARAGNQDMLENLESENQWRKENGLPSVEEELGLVPAAQKNGIRIFTKEEALERAKKYHVEKDVLWAIDQEGYTPNEAIEEWDLYEEGERPSRGEMVMVCLEHPEAPLWAVVPKEEWEKTIPTTEEVLELVEKQVSGQSFQEGIAEMEAAGRLLERDSLQGQLQRLVSALENVEITVEPATEEDESMTVEELSEAENSLLYPQERPVWDSPSA